MLDLFQVCYRVLSVHNWRGWALSLTWISQIQRGSSERRWSCQPLTAQIRLKREREDQDNTTTMSPAASLRVSPFPWELQYFLVISALYSQPGAAHLVLWQLTAPGNYYLIKTGNFAHFGRFLGAGLFPFLLSGLLSTTLLVPKELEVVWLWGTQGITALPVCWWAMSFEGLGQWVKMALLQQGRGQGLYFGK